MAVQMSKRLQKFTRIESKSMIDGISHEIELCNSRIRKISASEFELTLSIERLVKKAISEIENFTSLKNEKVAGLSLHYRLTLPFKNQSQTYDMEFPSKDKLSYENYLVAVLDAQEYVQYNFVFSNGAISETKANIELKRVKIQPEGHAVKRIILWYDASDA